MDLLEELLKWHHKLRKTAQQLIQTEFVQFHKCPENDQEIPLEDVLQTAADNDDSTLETSKPSLKKTKSVAIKGSVQRHQLYIRFKDFERSITFLLASMLSSSELTMFQKRLEEKVIGDHAPEQDVEVTQQTAKDVKMIVIKVQKLLDVLQDMNKHTIIAVIKQISGFSDFRSFSYHIELLTQFKNITAAPNYPTRALATDKSEKKSSSVHGTNVWSNFRNPASVINFSNSREARAFGADTSLPSRFRRGGDTSSPGLHRSAHGDLIRHGLRKTESLPNNV